MKNIPKWRDRQKLLFDRKHPTSPEKLSALGKSCFEKGYVQDAFEYYRAAEDQEGLANIKTLALEEGDAVLLDALETAGVSIPENDWNTVGYKAHELGKHQFAIKAFEKTNNEIMLAKLQSTSDDPEPE